MSSALIMTNTSDYLNAFSEKLHVLDAGAGNQLLTGAPNDEGRVHCSLLIRVGQHTMCC